MTEHTPEEWARLERMNAELLAALRDLAFELNSTARSGPVCWCVPYQVDANQPTAHTAACDKARAAMAKAEGKPDESA